MAIKPIRKLAPSVTAQRARIIGLRLRDEDRRRFERMASSAGVGVSTYARLIIEQYIETHGPRRKS
jgi:predicted DNA binding CopG/RHH family protein